MRSSRYTYGDSGFAAERLDLVARAFEPSSRAFLERVVPHAPDLAVDLGCGPGNTTRLLAAVLRAERTVGLDRSGPFLDRARRGAPPGVEFIEHDVVRVPFPVGPADVVSCRLLVSHLPDRAAVLARWATQLAPGGLLLLDELEGISSDEPAFVAYLAIARDVVEGAGGRLFVGPELATLDDPPGTERASEEVVSFAIAPTDSARIFGMNLAVLIERGEIDRDDGLVEALDAIVRRGDGSATIWRMRQLAFRRLP